MTRTERKAPAPADQSDRDGAIAENVAWLERYQKLIDGWMQVAIDKQRNATIARIDELNKRRALASAPSEAPKPPGQEPGGDPGVGRGEAK